MSQRKTSVTQSFFTCGYTQKNVVKNFPNFITVPLTIRKKLFKRHFIIGYIQSKKNIPLDFWITHFFLMFLDVIETNCYKEQSIKFKNKGAELISLSDIPYNVTLKNALPDNGTLKHRVNP